MGRPSNTKQRKQEIIQALLKVMSEQGYEKASIQAIAEQAGLTPGLIHYHFKTKQDILLALVNWIATAANERLEKLDKVVDDPWLKLEAFINARLATGDTEMPEVVAAWVVIAGESLRQPEIKEIYQDLIGQQLKMLKQLIANVWEGKSSKSKEVIHLSAIILAAMEGAFQLSATASEIMPKNYAANSVLELIKSRVGN
jgi:TetR/AcrR family transcriptional repressor of bet genes